MPSWWPLIWIITAIVVALVAAIYVSVRVRNKGSDIPPDFVDTEPVTNEYTRVDPTISDSVAPIHAATLHESTKEPGSIEIVQPIAVRHEPVLLDPAIQVAQDNLNYKLWHKLLWLIPNTTWIQTQHQSLAKVQWLCLGPDHYCFIARAELHHDEWKWSFTKA